MRCELAHSGLVRSALAALGLDDAQRLEVYDRLLEGGDGAVEELIAAHPDRASGLRVLFDVDGGGSAYLANLRAALLDAAPGSGPALDELEAAAGVLEEARCPFTIAPATAGGFEYYTGLTFRFFAGDDECLRGGRYDGLAESIGGRAVPASGFAADLLQLAELAPVAGSAS